MEMDYNLKTLGQLFQVASVASKSLKTNNGLLPLRKFTLTLLLDVIRAFVDEKGKFIIMLAQF